MRLQWIKDILKSPPIPFPYLAVVAFFFAMTLGSSQSHLISWLGIVFVCFHLFRNYWLEAKRFLLMFLIVCACFFISCRWWNDVQYRRTSDQVTRLRPEVDTIRMKGDLLSFRSGPYQVFYRLKSEGEQGYFRSLSRPIEMEVRTQVEEASPERNFKGFNYRSFLKNQGIYRVVRVKQVRSVSPVLDLNPFTFLKCFRKSCLLWIDAHFPTPMKHYMTGLLFGWLDSDFDEMGKTYGQLGIMHLFALSGMQVSFFIRLFRRAFLLCGLTRETTRKWEWCFSFIYAVLTGWSISVLRSLIQNRLGVYGYWKVDNIALTTMILYLIQPNYWLTIGGSLSCLYAFLIAMLPEGESGWKGKVCQSICLSLGVLPLLLIYFGEYQIWAVLLTFVFSFLFDVMILPLLTVSFFLSSFFIFREGNWLFIGLEKLVGWVTSILPKPFILGKPDTWIFVGMIMLLAILADYWKKKGMRFFLMAGLFSLFILTKHPLENEVTLIDMGKGQASLIRDARGQTILINLGESRHYQVTEEWKKREVASAVSRHLIPYLKSRGIDRIDSCILTTSLDKEDETLTELLNEIEVKELYSTEENMEQIESQMANSRPVKLPTIKCLRLADTWDVMGGRLSVIDLHKQSVSLSGSFLHASFLWLGKDWSREKIEELAQTDWLEGGVVVLGDHGKRLDEEVELLRAFSPERVVVSASQEGRKTYPPEDVLDRLEEAGLSGYRMDQRGALRYRGWRSFQVESVSNFWYNVGTENGGGS